MYLVVLYIKFILRPKYLRTPAWVKCIYSVLIPPSKELCTCTTPFLKIYKFIYFNWRLITSQFFIVFAIHQHEKVGSIKLQLNIIILCWPVLRLMTINSPLKLIILWIQTSSWKDLMIFIQSVHCLRSTREISLTVQYHKKIDLTSVNDLSF